jgi:hypothetical protein
VSSELFWTVVLMKIKFVESQLFQPPNSAKKAIPFGTPFSDLGKVAEIERE